MNSTLYEKRDDLYHMAAELLNAVTQGENQVPLETLIRAKGSDDNSAIYKAVLDNIPGSKVATAIDHEWVHMQLTHIRQRIGILSKDKFEGKVKSEWKTALSKYESNPEEVDVSAGVAAVLAVKDDEEAVSLLDEQWTHGISNNYANAKQRTIKAAAKISSQMLKEFFVHQMEQCIDQEKSITHEQLSEKTDAALLDPKQFKQLKLPGDVSFHPILKQTCSMNVLIQTL
jgi:nucleosome binding factor SPN SPT16 subunit